jgi:perosamine synthetase
MPINPKERSPSLPVILGGEPVRTQGPPDWPRADPEVATALQAALRDGSWGKYDGGHVAKLEAELAKTHAVPFSLTCASGTLAVELALRALQLAPGDEVIVPAYDYEPNFLCVHAVGATPVLVDVAPGNWNLDPNQLHAAIGPNTKAILVSHLHGGLAPMREVMAFAAEHGLRVVEDAAQATGAIVQGRRAGTWGDIGVLSFGGSKLLTASRGGALLTRHADVAQRIRIILRRGVQQWAALSELQAVVLLSQLARLDADNAERAANVQTLLEALAGVPGLCVFANIVEESQPAYYKLGFQFDEATFGLPRERFVAAMRAEGMAFDAGFRAVHLGRAPGRFRRGGELTEAERAHAGCVTLYHPVLLGTAADVVDVARAARKTYLNVERLR